MPTDLRRVKVVAGLEATGSLLSETPMIEVVGDIRWGVHTLIADPFFDADPSSTSSLLCSSIASAGLPSSGCQDVELSCRIRGFDIAGFASFPGVGHKLYWYINCAEWAGGSDDEGLQVVRTDRVNEEWRIGSLRISDLRNSWLLAARHSRLEVSSQPDIAG